MRKERIVILIIFINLILLCCQCSNQGDFYTLPKFDPIEVNEDMIFILKSEQNLDSIYAIDTKTDKVIYIYKDLSVYDFVYDYTFDKNIYLISGNDSFFRLDIKEGRLKKIEVEYPAKSIAIFDNKVWIGYGLYGRHFTYDPIKNKVEYIYLPGLFSGWWSCINNKYYLSVEQDLDDRIYNYTDKKILPEDVFGVKYSIYFFNSYYWDKNKGNYLAAYYYDGGSFDNDYTDFYYINSLEPSPDVKFIKRFKEGEGNDCVRLIGAYEKDNFAYLCYEEFLDFYISKIDKENNYSEVKKIRIASIGISFVNLYFRPPYIWIGSLTGIYKVNMDDLSCRRIIK